MGFGTLYVQVDRDVDEVKKEIENLKKRRAPQTQQIITVRKVDTSPVALDTAVIPQERRPADIMVEFKYDKKTNLSELQQQVSGVSGVHIIKSIASL